MTDSTDEVDEALLAIFRRAYITPDEAAFPHDSEGDEGYAWQTERLETEDALSELFEGTVTDAKLADYADKLNNESVVWARASDVASVHE